MAKKIKFNLLCDGYPIRTIEELQEHFNIGDVLEYYLGEDHLLVRWLKLRDFNDELSKVNAIQKTERQDIAKELVRIFGVDMDEDDVDSYFRSEQYNKERDKRNTDAANAGMNAHIVIEKYRLGFQELLKGIQSKDLKEQKFALERLWADYKWAFELAVPKLIQQFKSEDCVDSILFLLKNSQTRELLIDSKRTDDYGRCIDDYGLCKWLAERRDKLKKVAKKLGLSVKSYYVKSGQMETIIEEGTICLVSDVEYPVNVTSVNNVYWTSENSFYNGLKVNNDSDYSSGSVEYIVFRP